MKFLELKVDDSHLYNLDTYHYRDYLSYISSKIPLFKHMYHDQGEAFWLRHLLNLREYLYILIRMRFEYEHGQCLHWLLNPLEKIFIRIHKLFFAKGFNSAKKSLGQIIEVFDNMETLPFAIKHEKTHLASSNLTESPYKALFGSNTLDTEADGIKIYFACGLYKYFCRSLVVLIERYENANPMPKNAIDCLYWKPFSFWKNKDFHPELFENYIARFYRKRLSDILLTPDIHLIFKTERNRNCCFKFFTDLSSKVLTGELYHQKQYSQCIAHNVCYIRIVHAENCKNPYSSCLKKPFCYAICDTDYKFDKYAGGSDYWKRHDVTIHESTRKNFRDVATLSETNDYAKTVEQYIVRVGENTNDWNEKIDDLTSPDNYSPKSKKGTKQTERNKQNRSPLRSKLSEKKEEKSLSKEDLCSNDSLPVNLALSAATTIDFENYEYRTDMLHHAQIQFRTEINDELLCKVLKEKFGKFDDPLIDIFKVKFEIEDLYFGEISVDKKYRSIGEGTDIPVYFEFFEFPKIMHINERLQMKNKMPYILEMGTTDNNDEEDNANASICRISAQRDFRPSEESLKNIKEEEQKFKSEKGSTCEDATDDVSYAKTSPNMTADIFIDMKKEIDNIKERSDSYYHYKIKMKSEIKTAHDLNIEQGMLHCEKEKQEKCDHTDKLREVEYLNYFAKSINELGNSVVSHLELFYIGTIATNSGLVKSTEIGDNVSANESIQHSDEGKIACGGTNNEVKLEKANEDTSVKRKVKTICEPGKTILKIRICAGCNKEEIVFKKCKLCPDLHFGDPRYYCSKDCQLKDWKAKHQEKHWSFEID